MSELFSSSENNQDNAQQSVFDQLVGEGKKFRDQEALARGKDESDRLIPNLQQQIETLKAEIAKRSTTEELLEKIKQEASSRSNEITPESSQPNVQRETIDHNKVFEIAKQVISQERASETKARNVDLVKSKLIEAFGTDYVATLKAKVSILGLTEQYAAQLAEDNPQAFLNIVVGQQRSVVNSAISPRNSQVLSPSMTPDEAGKFKEAVRTRKYRDQNYQLDIHRKSIDAGRSVLGE